MKAKASSSCCAVVSAARVTALAAVARPCLRGGGHGRVLGDGGVDVKGEGEADGVAGAVADDVADDVADGVVDGEDLTVGESVCFQRGIQG